MSGLVPGGCVVVMASGSMPDSNDLVDMWLEQECKIKRSFGDYPLLRVRETATSREIDIIYKRMSMLLHPDENHFSMGQLASSRTLTRRPWKRAPTCAGMCGTTTWRPRQGWQSSLMPSTSRP